MENSKTTLWKWIQIQHLLKLNLQPFGLPIGLLHSNTTFVKVKWTYCCCKWYSISYSNTTFVKVKYLHHE